MNAVWYCDHVFRVSEMSIAMRTRGLWGRGGVLQCSGSEWGSRIAVGREAFGCRCIDDRGSHFKFNSFVFCEARILSACWVV